jgi:DsbC/DsbD-like thiol-disulfide interchange protein
MITSPRIIQAAKNGNQHPILSGKTLYQEERIFFQDIHFFSRKRQIHLNYYYSYDISKFIMVKVLCFLYLFLYITVFTVFSTIIHQTDHVNAHLITDVQSIQPGRPFSVGVLLELEKGWHTYWLNPGDSGLPVAIEWKLPIGFIPGDIQWPYPGRLGTDFVVNFGYEEEVFLITEIQASPAARPGETITIEANVDWLVCKEECLPGQTELSLSLPVQDKEPAPDLVWSKKFADTRKKLPIYPSDWTISAAIYQNFVLLSISSPSWFENEMKDIQFFPEQLELFDYSAPQFFEKTEDGYIIKAKLSSLTRKIPSKLQGVLVSDKSWSRDSDSRAIRIVVPFEQYKNEDKKTQKEVSL